VSAIVEIRLPQFPDCWDECGSCGAGGVTVAELLVPAGAAVGPDDAVLVLDTGKVALEIPAGRRGRILEWRVAVGDAVEEGQVVLRIETAV
jgi:pyruvate dehydrogenase E2 component (dihydrolipoamide acetyltransferase)